MRPEERALTEKERQSLREGGCPMCGGELGIQVNPGGGRRVVCETCGWSPREE